MTTELERGLKDMIVVSSNEATQYILDVITDTSSGSELPQKQFDAWQYKRNRVNRWYTALGYLNINVDQKTFCEDAYGIEQQSRKYKGENRNALTLIGGVRSQLLEALPQQVVGGEVALRAAHQVHRVQVDAEPRPVDRLKQTQVAVRGVRVQTKTVDALSN